MPSAAAIAPVVTRASPNSLKSLRLSASTRERVRWVRTVLPSTLATIALAASLSRDPRRSLERRPAAQVVQGLGEVRGREAQGAGAPPATPEVHVEAAVRILEEVATQANAVAREHGAKRGRALEQVAARARIGVLAHPLARGIAEHVGEEDLAVVGLGLEEHDVAAGILRPVLGDSGGHPRMDHRAEGLR